MPVLIQQILIGFEAISETYLLVAKLKCCWEVLYVKNYYRDATIEKKGGMKEPGEGKHRRKNVGDFFSTETLTRRE